MPRIEPTSEHRPLRSNQRAPYRNTKTAENDRNATAKLARIDDALVAEGSHKIELEAMTIARSDTVGLIGEFPIALPFYGTNHGAHRLVDNNPRVQTVTMNLHANKPSVADECVRKNARLDIPTKHR
ncbi:MAG: hypothetical protein Tsb0020_08900 [Haliangiales bacterium]